ncbi:MAG: hypothetical protein D6776_00520 [Planctomycetota bacterium]|nr:MAG: hypothetical protein D6776_00520 [Planctomycetota bacterium]
MGLGFVALLAAVMPARAQEAKPRLDGFMRLRADGTLEPVDKSWDVLPGAVVWVGGTNFTDEVQNVKVSVDDKPALVLAAQVDRIQFLVPPDTKAGKHTVQVEVDGRRSNTLSLKVVEPTPENIERIGKRDAAEFEDPGRSEIEKKIELITLSVPQAISERGMTVIRFSGKAQLPEGCVIALDLKLDGEPVGNAEAEVIAPYNRSSDNFQGQFGPFRKRMFSGNYSVEAYFRLADQPAKVRYRFRKELGKRELAKLSSGYARNYVYVGNRTQEELEKQELRKHFRRTTDKILGLLDELETQFSLAGRADPRWHKSGEGVDEAAWEAWLKKRSLKGMSASEQREWLERLRTEQGPLTPEGDFDEAAWREWLDRSWREEVLALYRQHRAYVEKWQTVRFNDAMLEMESLFGALIKLSQNRSRYIYEHQGLAVDANDARPPGADELRLGVSLASPIGIRRTVKRILTEIGLE